MKVLIATAESQGQAANDYCWTVEDELVRLVDCPDDLCRCSAFGGIESHKASTTALVVERADLDPSTLVQVFRQDLENQGYAEYLSEAELNETILGELADLVVMLRDVAPGAVVERWGPGIRVRTVRAA
jgi:hypothetical protein